MENQWPRPLDKPLTHDIMTSFGEMCEFRQKTVATNGAIGAAVGFFWLLTFRGL